jgi:hypothetical protein
VFDACSVRLWAREVGPGPYCPLLCLCGLALRCIEKYFLEGHRSGRFLSWAGGDCEEPKATSDSQDPRVGGAGEHLLFTWPHPAQPCSGRRPLGFDQSLLVLPSEKLVERFYLRKTGGRGTQERWKGHRKWCPHSHQWAAMWLGQDIPVQRKRSHSQSRGWTADRTE